MKKLFGKSEPEAPKAAGPEVDQRVDMLIRGLGRTGGTVREVTPESLTIALIVDPTKGEQPPSEPEAIMEFTGVRGLYRQKGSARFDMNGGTEVHFLPATEPELMQRRQFARVAVNIPVNVSLQSGGFPLECDALNLSGNGILLASSGTSGSLEVGTPVWLSIRLYDKEGSISAQGMVVRDAGKGARGVRFDHIGERDQERLVRFVMRQEREQRKKGNL
jgi:hypothetical protein